MFLVAPLINRVDNRLIILFGLLPVACARPESPVRKTLRWREPDSNRRSPVYGELGAPAPRAPRPTRHREAAERRSFASTSSAGGVRHAGDQAQQVVERRPGMPPAVPPEGEFVEIALEVLFARAMERAGEPALQIGEHPMHRCTQGSRMCAAMLPSVLPACLCSPSFT